MKDKQIREALKLGRHSEVFEAFMFLLSGSEEVAIGEALSEGYVVNKEEHPLPSEIRHYRAGFAAGLKGFREEIEGWISDSEQSGM